MPLRESADQFIHATSSVSDNIRALAAAGYSRADIARILNKRYQHVRNVLEADKLKDKTSRPRQPAQARDDRPRTDGIYRLPLGENGEVVLPEALERALGLRRGGVVVAEFNGDALTILSSETALKRAQDLVRSLAIPAGVSLADELIADRRREAELEDRDG